VSPLVFSCLFVFLFVLQNTCAEERPTEDGVKAAYLYNFGKFMRHPEADAGKNDICILGRNTIAKVLEDSKSSDKGDAHPIRNYDKAADARNCEIVYMGASESEHIEKDLAALQGSNVLTVSDVPQFLEKGGMIQLLLQNNRIRFAVNLDAVGRTNIQLSSELLKVAVYVNSSARTEDKP